LSGIAGLLDQAAALAVGDGDLQRAARLSGAAAQLTASSGAELTSILKQTSVEDIAEGPEAPSRADVAAAWAEGQAMTLEEVVDYALNGLAVTPAA